MDDRNTIGTKKIEKLQRGSKRHPFINCGKWWNSSKGLWSILYSISDQFFDIQFCPSQSTAQIMLIHLTITLALVLDSRGVKISLRKDVFIYGFNIRRLSSSLGPSASGGEQYKGDTQLRKC